MRIALAAMRVTLAVALVTIGRHPAAAELPARSLRPRLSAAAGDPAAQSLYSRATFSWLNPMLKQGSKRPLEEADLPELAGEDSSSLSASLFERHWEALHALGATGRPNAAALALFRCFGKEFVAAGAVKLGSDACQLASPLLLRAIIGRLEAGAGMRSGGARLTLALLVVSCVQAFALRHYFAMLFRTGGRLRAALVAATYRKLLRLSPASRGAVSSGELTSLMGADASRVADLVPYLHALWFAPLQVLKPSP